MGAGNETGYVEELNGDGALAVPTRAVVGPALIGFVEARAGTVNLKVADSPLGVNGGETEGGVRGGVMGRSMGISREL